ncbi:MAG: DUF3880 domain-containing protein [Lachnospiraceae bacterium]|nr:DUF3880 domain-containing protein [Lachnospiraceae bacterium]
MSKGRILLYRWNAYNYLDICETFSLMGYEIDEVRFEPESYDEDKEFYDILKNKILTTSYLFAFSVNYFPIISNVCDEYGLPYLCWTCDNPLISMYHKSVFNSVNHIFTFDKTNLIEFKRMGVKNIYYLPLAVDSGRIQSILTVADDLYEYQNEISFVGSLYEKNSYDSMESVLPDYLRGYFEGIMEVQSDLYGTNILENALTEDILKELDKYYTLEKSADSFSSLQLIFSTTVLGFKTAEIQRKRELLKLSRINDVSLYSNSDATDLITVNSKGSLDYYSEMPKVFNQSRINLNFTIPNIKTGIPLRVWDILGSGGFCLTNYQAELSDYFKDGQDLAWFYGTEDLIEKAKWYLAHDSERRRIAHSGFNKTREHNYMKRLDQMLTTVNF